MTATLASLRQLHWTDLDRLYIDSPPGPVPTGEYRGTLLRWLPPAKKLRNVPFVTAEFVGFKLSHWGIDFLDHQWWIALKCLRGGKFSATQEPSRWRPTECWQMRYEQDWFPPVRKFLYDEVKSLTADVCLGIGGINAPAGTGDHFFYSLHRV